MTRDRRLLQVLAAVGVALAVWLAGGVLLIASTLDVAERAVVGPVLEPRLPLLLLAWVVAVAGAAAGLSALHRRYPQAAARLLDDARALVAPGAVPRPTTSGAPELKALAGVISTLADQRDRLREDVEARVAQANTALQQERNRLAALMSELTRSVIVCNRDGRILLYNRQARLESLALSEAPALADGAELIGIGRSVYEIIDQPLLEHAQQAIRRQIDAAEPRPSAQFVTATRSGQLLRVHMTPVRAAGDTAGDAGSAPEQSGFVLMFDNVTRSFEADAERDQFLHGLTEGSRASLASIQAAVDVLGFPELETAQRERFMVVVRDEVAAMTRRIDALAEQSSRGLSTRWPLEDIRAADLVDAAGQRIEAECDVTVGREPVDDSIWLTVDGFSLLQALTHVANRVVDSFAARRLTLRLKPLDGRARLDLIWAGSAMSTETALTWELEPIRIGARSTSLTVRDVVERHGGEMWFERDRARQESFFRFLLPCAAAASPRTTSPLSPTDARPEFYDFDLFRMSDAHRALDDQPLGTLTYTVFDTETTGLEPSAGDEIIQIGAARIVNGRLLRGESFEQLVDPGRPIPPASIPIHGITQDRVAGKPRIGDVLPVFHRFARDTVLVAHNAAFDMRFLQLKEESTGVVFGQPVLDTLLLSAVVNPAHEAHRLEAIAERFGIPVVGRHTALGDAIVTAEVMLRLIPLLEEKGIRTLGAAREASRKTLFARLQY